ncbi:MAG: thioredoxin [Candidatus Bipolaricaulota bacterium]|nr:thioredoxin [Candidatus Bipolaricaulota bacterium]MDW8111433.1 thioredoxin [Candidatus Bipolaricaulota bacterium]MDW8329746.1 thioredoxin [Candidatus Bipolaricaulota bacterium]
MANLLYLSDRNFSSEVLQSAQPTLVDFYADWCGPCRAIAPIIEEIAHELAGRLKVAKLDVDQNQEIALQYGVQSIPTLILFKNGREVERWIGYMSKSKLLSKIEPHLR